MGKLHFEQIYQAAEAALGATPTLKVSGLSDEYNDCDDFAGIIVYHHNNAFCWYNDKGAARGYNIKPFYVYILNTECFPEEVLAAGQGIVHDYLYAKLFQEDFRSGRTCCGGFSVTQGSREYSSTWFNERSYSKHASFKQMLPWKSDGSKYLSEHERLLVDAALDAWMEEGSGAVAEVPDQVQRSSRRELRAY